MVRLGLRSRRRQFARFAGRLEPGLAMGPVAERLVFRSPAPAQPDGRASAQAEFFSSGVLNAELTLHFDGAVVVDRDFCRHAPDGSKWKIVLYRGAQLRPAQWLRSAARRG